jgi:hypothetical protein
MAERFDVARDAYYWGQDRLGSLLPALGAVLVALGVPSLDALAWVQLGVLLASGLVWLRLLRNPLLGALGFAAMLLPVFPFHESVAIGHPYLAQQFFWLLWLSVLDRGTVSQGGALRALGLPLLGLAALWASAYKTLPVADPDKMLTFKPTVWLKISWPLASRAMAW